MGEGLWRRFGAWVKVIIERFEQEKLGQLFLL
jgi:hypothetical protein